MKVELPKISLGKYYMRSIDRSDYLDYFYIGCDTETVKYLSWGPFKTLQESLWVMDNIFLKRVEDGIPIGYAIVEKKSDKMIGVIDFHTYYPDINTGEIGYILAREYWGNGIMTQALRAIIDVGFQELDLDKIIIGHVKENEGSKHVILKNKFKYEFTNYGKFTDRSGKKHDVLMYSMYKFEYERGILK